MEKIRAFISLGSNMEGEKNFFKALTSLLKNDYISDIRISNSYKTAAVGCKGFFYNAVIVCRTASDPGTLKFKVLRSIEDSLGRIRSADKNAPRPIDLDLIIMGNEKLEKDGLILPDPDIFERDFLAICILELDHKIVVDGVSLKWWADKKKWSVDNNPGMELLPGLSSRLKELCVNEQG